MERVRRTHRTVGQHRGRLAAALDTLSTDVADLKTQLALLLKQEQEKDVKPRRWAARATGKDWDTLIDWVDRLNTDYSLLGDFTIPPCWPAHPGVVEELAGLHRSWTRAMINDQLGKKTGGNDLTAWHDRWLWPCPPPPEEPGTTAPPTAATTTRTSTQCQADGSGTG